MSTRNDDIHAIGRRQGTWAQWGPRRRRLIALSIANWIALGGVIVLAIALDEPLEYEAPLLIIGMSASVLFGYWLSRQLRDAERAEGALDADGTTDSTRELLLVGSVAEAIELIGIAIFVVTAPAAVGMAFGGVLWLLGGRSAAGVARAALGRRLYRSPVGDDTRKRWRDWEFRLTAAALVAVVAVAILRSV